MSADGVGGGAQSKNNLVHADRWDCGCRRDVLTRFTAWLERHYETGDQGWPDPADKDPLGA